MVLSATRPVLPQTRHARPASRRMVRRWALVDSSAMVWRSMQKDDFQGVVTDDDLDESIARRLARLVAWVRKRRSTNVVSFRMASNRSSASMSFETASISRFWASRLSTNAAVLASWSRRGLRRRTRLREFPRGLDPTTPATQRPRVSMRACSREPERQFSFMISSGTSAWTACALSRGKAASFLRKAASDATASQPLRYRHNSCTTLSATSA
mmetsp:Transcript_28411/g.91581  ORF Transcript_28411/g.91581 Transcript_28411/m.91581 type:complete len:213 (-) Transcript_28411:584-1222(-)